jgi:predicted YcjX-like family ATPase
MPVLQDMAQAGTLSALAAALASFLRRCAARAFAPPDPGAHLLQGALHGMLTAVRDFTTRRAAAPQV